MAKGKPATEVVVEPDPPSELDESIEVDLTEKPPAPKAPTADEIAKQLQDFQAKYDASLKAMENQLAASRRINERLQREMSQRPTLPVTPLAPTPPADELDQLVESGQWKQAVAKLAAQEAERLYQARETERQRQEVTIQRQTRLASAKEEVVKYYPELDPESGDPESIVHKAYVEVLNHHPEYLGNEFGPVLAMRDMESTLRDHGMEPRSWKAPATKPSPDALRRERTQSTTLPPGRPSGATNAFVLTKEQKTIAEQTGIPLEDYAKYAKALETGGEVTT